MASGMQGVGPTSASGSSAAFVVGGGGGAKNDKDKPLPKDAQVMISILKDMGISEFEPRVVNQFLEFAYRYVTTILEDSKVLANHAKKRAVDMEDVKLAVQMFTEQNFTTPPPRDILLESARNKNISALPVPKPTSGMRLPPDRHCLTACNFRLKRKSKSSKPYSSYDMSYMNAAAAMVGGASSSATAPLPIRPNQKNLDALRALQQSVGHQQNSSSAPSFKLSPAAAALGGGGPGGTPKFQIRAPAMDAGAAAAAGGAPVQFQIQVSAGAMQPGGGGGLQQQQLGKRKREDEDYDA